MKRNKLIADALAMLTDTERKLLCLLTEETATGEEVIDFLNHYEINGESAVSTFLINDLLDKYRLQEYDIPSIPRIRGVSEFYRFQNATAIMRQPADEPFVDIDLYLKIKYPDDIRPFPTFQVFLDRKGLVYLTGRKYADKVLNRLEPAELQNKEYFIPEDSFLPDIVYMGLYRSVRYKQNKAGTLCYLYDRHRYCSGKKPSLALRLSLLKQNIRHRLGRVKRWLLTGNC